MAKFNILFIFLLPFSLLYGGALLIRDGLYRTGILKEYKCEKPVISIGNLTVGGTGKTPMTIYIAQYLSTMGYTPAILTRGYGSEKKSAPLIFNGKEAGKYTVGQIGDEPMMISAHIPDVKIYVFPDRVLTAKTASREADILLLDDGFQRKNIFKDMNILLVDVNVRFGNGFLLPAGNLRGFTRYMRQAHCILLTKTNLANPKSVTAFSSKLPQSLPIFTQTQTMGEVYRYETRETVSLEYIKSKKLVAFCALAQPDAFYRSLEERGIPLYRKVSFRDHHAYPVTSLNKLGQILTETRADYMITTEKDAVKLQQATPSFNKKLLVTGLTCGGLDEFDRYLRERIDQLAAEYRLNPKEIG